MSKYRFFSYVFLLITSVAIVSCASKASTKLLDGKRGIYEVSMQNFENCGGAWNSKSMCVDNLRPQIVGLSADVCGKQPNAIHSCDARDSDKGTEVFCIVECNAAPKVEQTVIRKARLCQERGGIWVDNRCEVDLSQ